jgi:hypothetical protein
MKKWLVIAGLKLVSDNEETVGVFLDLVGNILTWELIECCFRNFETAFGWILWFT